MSPAQLVLERQADRLISVHRRPNDPYPAYSTEYLRRKAARHHECYLSDCYTEPMCDYYSDAETYTPFVRMLALLFRLPADLVADILAHDPDAGLPSSWPDVDALKRMRLRPNMR